MNVSDSFAPSESLPMMSHETYETCMGVVQAPLFLLAVTGIVTNAVNIAVFVRQGAVSDSTTVSLLSLAVSDLLSCAFALPQPACFYLEKYVRSESVFIKDCFVLTTMSAAYPHIISTQVTIWITVYISVERAVCVLFPLNVKQLIKTKNTIVFMVSIYVIAVVFHMPFAANSLIILVTDPAHNATVKAVNYQTPLGALFYRLNNTIRSNIFTTVAMIIVAVATLLMVARLKATSQWRASVSINGVATKAAARQLSKAVSLPANESKKASTKEKETIKVVTCVTAIFLFCLTCSHFPGLVMYVIPGYAIDGLNRELFHLTYTLKFLFDVLNSALNFFFYVKMSTKFRRTLLAFIK